VAAGEDISNGFSSLNVKRSVRMRTRSIFMILILVAVFVAAGAFSVSACQKGAPPAGKNSHMQAQCTGGQMACDPAMCAKMGCDPAKCAQTGCDPAKCAKIGCDPAQCAPGAAGQKCAPGACKGATGCAKTTAAAQAGAGCGKH
jgi:hypothetical protein